jgi:hypothetical protein
MPDASDAKKKGGRPKAQPDGLPIIIAEARSRVQEMVTMPAYHYKVLRRYVKWASRKASFMGVMLTEDEAMSLVLSQGIDLILQKDKAWAEDKKAESGEDDDPAGPAVAAAKSPAAREAATRPPAPLSPAASLPARTGTTSASAGREA